MSTEWMLRLMYDCVTWRDTDGNPIGQLAKSWTVVNDTTWHYRLHEGGKFWNGEDLDAHAVKFTIDRMLANPGFLPHGQWTFIKEINVLDKYTVEVVTHEPWPAMLYDIGFTGCGILPPKYFQEVGAEGFEEKPIGSGPYILTEFRRNEYYVLEAWDGYWGGRPEVDRIIFRVVPEMSTRVAGLLTGEINFLQGIPPTDLDRVRRASGLRMAEGPTNLSRQIIYKGTMEAVGSPSYVSPTTKLEIRAAIDHAIDRNILAEIHAPAYPTLARVAHGTAYVPDHLHGPEAARKRYDPERSRQLIRQAGYDPAAGNKPKLEFIAQNINFNKEIAEAIKAMLEEVGFEIDLKIYDPTKFREVYQDTRSWKDLAMVDQGLFGSRTPTYYTCTWPFSGFCNSETDELVGKIMTTLDFNKQVEYYHQWWELMLFKHYGVNALYEINAYYAMPDWLDWEPRSDGWLTFLDAKVKD